MGAPITDDDLAIVRDCELAINSGALRGDRPSASALLHEDFHEFGQSGRVWDKESVLDLMEDTAEQSRIEVVDLQAFALGTDAVLATYDTVTPEGRAHRSSVWVRAGGRWQLRHHQGTAVPIA